VSLAALQYYWIGQVSQAEGERLRQTLQSSLNHVSQEFNSDLGTLCAAIAAPRLALDPAAHDVDYIERFQRIRESAAHHQLIRTIWMAVPEGQTVRLRSLNATEDAFVDAEWPASWSAMRDRLISRLNGEFGPGDRNEQVADLVEIPRFIRPERPERDRRRFAREMEWLLVELDIDYARSVFIPELLERDLGASAMADYDVDIVMRENPAALIYSSLPGTQAHINLKNADASVLLFDVRTEIARAAEAGPGTRRRRPMIAGVDRGRWLLSVRHKSGSLEAVVQKARLRNLAVNTGLLVLLIAAMVALVRYTRRAQRLAELQMEFVAGVSHELRTPLTVMRTAGHNLRGRMASDPARVQRYGALIEEESEKLTAMVEQVLGFANANAGRVIGEVRPVAVDDLIEEAVRGARKLIDDSGCKLDVDVAPNLPPILGDGTALEHVVQNLLTNAAKYAGSGGWIGLSAAAANGDAAPGIEIRVADRGPGIPTDEVPHIFDPFYRGKKAIQDQIHGAGLGLSLARRIVDAHHGIIQVHTDAGRGTEFLIRLPAAAVEKEHEFEDSVSGG
jgi:signal transduction histidine kinase